MKDFKQYDVIIVGGSYSGLAAAMSLGRALRKVLIIDSSSPCNRQTPYSHNFLTQDGKAPAEIASAARRQVEKYSTVEFFNGVVIRGAKTENGFEMHTASGDIFSAVKLIFATGIRDMLPDIDGITACWGISVLHCPFCHGYEVKGEKTGILGNGADGYELASLITNWTNDLTLFTNGTSTLTAEQTVNLKKHHIKIIETDIALLEQNEGCVQYIVFGDGSKSPVKAIYTRAPFRQHCHVPESLGCELTEDGYIKVNPLQETTINGVYACGDNTTRIRTVANAVAAGTTAGMMVSRQLIAERF
jgi:thioredoxin reductase